MRLAVKGLGLVRCDLPKHGIGDIGLDDAILGFQSLGQFHQRSRGDFHRRLQCIAVPVVKQILVAVGLSDGHRARDAFDFLQWPPRPAHVQVLEQVDGIPEPGVAVFSAFSDIKRHVVLIAEGGHKLHIHRLVLAPVFVWRVHQLIVPRRGQPREVIGKPVAFDENDVVRVDRADAVRALHVQAAQSGSIWEVPVGFVEQVVPGDPLFAHIVLSNALPQRHHFVLVVDALPQGRLRRVVVRDLLSVALAAGSCVQVQDDVHLVGGAPGHQAVGQFKPGVDPGVFAGYGLVLNR